MAQFQLDLVESELKIVLGALLDMEKKLSKQCDIFGDEDEVSEVANDLVEIRLLLKPLKEKAVKKFGKGVLNFSS